MFLNIVLFYCYTDIFRADIKTKTKLSEMQNLHKSMFNGS